MDALPVILLLIILSSILIIGVLVENARPNKAEKFINERAKGVTAKREDRAIENAQVLPPKLERVLSKEEKKKFKNKWKQAETSRHTMEKEEVNQQLAREIIAMQKDGRLGRDFAAVSKIEQNRKLYEIRRSVSAVKRKYGTEAALNFIRTNWPVNGATSTAKSLKPYTPAMQQTEKSGWVYVIQDKTTGLYKIGRTKNIERRMKQLGVGKSARLIQRKMVVDSYAVERTAHQRYKNSRLPQTEYFKLSSPPVLDN